MTRRLTLFYGVLFFATLLFAHLIDKCSAGFAAVGTGEIQISGASHV